jgi:hypothetical protein
MARHEELLNEGPREAPEPETAEEKSKKLGLKTAGGVVAGGGAVAAKAGLLTGVGKFFFWAAIWNGILHGGWIGVAIALAVVGVWFVHHRRQVG